MTINSLDDLEYPLSPAEKNLIVEKLYSLKSLDPACGSGAFPIGLLQ
jgi:type II restriction/modification system DNA methylase subunit YeeA